MWKKFLIFCVVGVFLAGCATTTKQASDKDLDGQLKTLQKRVQEQDREIASLKSELDVARAEIKGVPAPTTYSSNIVVKKKAAPAATSDMTSKNIQTALAGAGYYTGKIDGKIGPESQKAIKAFQADNGLKVDGIVGPKTWDKLKEYLNIK